MTEKYTTVSFSGGKDSTAMLLHMIELGEHIDEVINCDTGMEFPAMYDHIDKVREIVESHGIKYTTIRGKYSFEYYMLELPIKSEKYGDHIGYGWPSMNCRWCTKHLKTEPTDKYLKELRQTYDVIQCIGLASDEVKRLRRANNQKASHRHPLVEWGWTEADCLQYCRSKGFDWNGLYDIFNRVSCWCCPMARTEELRKLWEYFPDLWHQLEVWETRLGEPDVGKRQAYWFKDHITVFDLAERFTLERQRIERGLSIRSPGFYRTLNATLRDIPETQKTLWDWDSEGSA